MILPFSTHKQLWILIPFAISLFTILCVPAFASIHNSNHSLSLSLSLSPNPHTTAMKVHPIPIPKKRIIAAQYGLNPHKKLRRLPHIFSRVLELPFASDADVSVKESPQFFRFVAQTDDLCNVRAHTFEIHPGVTKTVVRGPGFVGLSLDELELDMWRFRLPESTRPELASAVCVHGELVVTVPKIDAAEDD